MAEGVITFALEQLRDLLYEEGRLLSGVGSTVKKLEKQLVEMKCLIEEADKRRHESPTVKNFIAEIRELADRAEDAIEIYAVRVSSKRRRGVKKVLRRYACILKECQLLHQLDSEISEIKSGLEIVIKKMQDYGIMKKVVGGGESSATSNNQNWARNAHPGFKNGDCFVGMKNELKQLVSLIQGEQHPIISVWGMGGLGKTTIARQVYKQMKNQPKPASRFDRFAWVCISQKFKIHLVLENLLNQLDPQMRENASNLQQIPQLIERLCEVQRAHRCLVVIDDLWETSHWNAFKHAFLEESLRTKVLVTTRKENVAEIGLSLKLGKLNMDEAWELLKNKAFPCNNIPVHSPEKLHEIGTKILRKCGCLPLAISLLGGVLSKKSMDDWESVQENMSDYMIKAEGVGKDEYQIRGVLGLSYEELPYYLKPCFLYLGTLEEDESISVSYLYTLWIAQGMISSERHGGKKDTSMDIAEIYLGELASRCIVEVEVEDIIPTKKYRSCKLHDVVREQCRSIGENERFGFQNLKLPGENRRKTSLTRYLVIHVDGKLQEGVDELANEDTNKHVRSLKIVANSDPKLSKESNSLIVRIIDFPAQSIVDFQRFKMLRDLVIIGFRFGGREFPRGITNLVHLRCLHLEKCEELDELPSSISELVYLEILDLLQSFDIRIPNVLKKMRRLKHLLLPTYREYKKGSYRLRLDEGLDELETIVGYDSTVHEIKCTTSMKNLRRLFASVHDIKSLSVIISVLDTNRNKLQSFRVSIERDCELTSEEGSMMLKKVLTFPSLHDLRITVKLGKVLVECMNNMISSKLAVLHLRNSEIEDDPMGILGKLPFLRVLLLLWGSFVGEELTCPASSFPRLKTLYLTGLPKLREWRVEAGAMPLLSELRMDDCPCLLMVPDGLSSISTLQELEMLRMPELSKRIAPSGEDFPKVSHIPLITIDDLCRPAVIHYTM